MPLLDSAAALGVVIPSDTIPVEPEQMPVEVMPEPEAVLPSNLLEPWGDEAEIFGPFKPDKYANGLVTPPDYIPRDNPFLMGDFVTKEYVDLDFLLRPHPEIICDKELTQWREWTIVEFKRPILFRRFVTGTSFKPAIPVMLRFTSLAKAYADPVFAEIYWIKDLASYDESLTAGSTFQGQFWLGFPTIGSPVLWEEKALFWLRKCRILWTHIYWYDKEHYPNADLIWKIKYDRRDPPLRVKQYEIEQALIKQGLARIKDTWLTQALTNEVVMEIGDYNAARYRSDHASGSGANCLHRWAATPKIMAGGSLKAIDGHEEAYVYDLCNNIIDSSGDVITSLSAQEGYRCTCRIAMIGIPGTDEHMRAVYVVDRAEPITPGS